ncbi:MAG: hypothetical protein OQJ96_09150 [Flavobacteriales bacterium]|nr:hypothetical protein [Flavobacteriales bacterium]MCW8912904.1 hypothetical protein [Flavobacteriales bacterium]MCW8937253.1 hypothetical protein [Flavobacteriales bacterium]MCW8941004.1 hypothetical protein [Flavobacteriales bacterium]MCW8967786.1 hypothetical protein [Flavobacteriales bacterium]
MRGSSINDDFNENDISVGDIIWYQNEDIDNPEPHPHVAIAIDENYIYTVCGTSKEKTIERKAKHLNLDYSWFPCLGPDKLMGLKCRTFFDCCNYFEIYAPDLQDKYQAGEDINISGKIPYSDYEQIRTALKSNPAIDICDILIHPEDD